MSQNFNITKPLNRKQLNKLERRIGWTLHNARIDLGLSMAELARAAGISHQQVYKIERGINRLTLSRFHIFMVRFGLSPRSFYEMAFGTDWEAGIRLENGFKAKLFAIIHDMSEQEREAILKLIMAARSVNSKKNE